jgi:DNA-binding SARP family transcriptional activator
MTAYHAKKTCRTATLEKKSALLAYLVMNQRSLRREKLCSLL